MSPLFSFPAIDGVNLDTTRSGRYFGAFQIEYIEVRGWTPIQASLPFISMFLGCMLGISLCYSNQTFYLSRLIANNNHPVPVSLP